MHEDMPIADYIADTCPEPSLRSGDINRMLRLTPYHVRALHPRLSDRPELAIKKATKRMDQGSVIHALVLGRGADFTVIDPTEYKTKKGERAKRPTDDYRAAVADAEERGLLVLNFKQNADAQNTATALQDSLAEEFGSWLIGITEPTFIWREHTEFGDVWCRTRPDFFDYERASHGDIKNTGEGIDDDSIERSISYDSGAKTIQLAWQRRGILQVFPELRERLTSMHIFAEFEYPNLARVVHAATDGLIAAGPRMDRAVRMFARCRQEDVWPKWQRITAQPTTWLAAQWAREELAAESEGA